MDRKELDAWMAGYIQAWGTNDPAAIGGLLASDALYYTAPYRVPWKGREGVVAGWLGRKDEPGEYEFRYKILGVDGRTGFVRGWTRYYDGPTDFSNLWMVRLNRQGECEVFVEWWMEEKD